MMFALSYWIADDQYQSGCGWLVTVVLIGMAALLFWLQRRTSPSAATRNLPPGSSGWPVIGETLDFILDGHEFVRRRIARYGVVFRTSILGQDVVVVSGAEHVRRVLLAEGRSVVSRLPDSVRMLIGDGTLTETSGERHGRLHRFVARTFRLDNLRRITPVVHGVIKEFVADWRRRGDVISGVAEMKRLAFRLGVDVLLGLDFRSDDMASVSDIFDTYNKAFFSFPIDLPGFAYRKGKRARQKLIELLRRHLADLSGKSNDARLHLIRDLMARHEVMTSENGDVSWGDGGDPINLTVELIFGSKETLASALSSIVMYLGHRSDVCARIRDELTRRGAHASDELMTYDDVTSARYVQHVVDEVLRIYPPVAGSFRKTIRPMRIAGYDIPVGWTILYSIPSTHQLSPLFKYRTNELVPERWQTRNERDHCRQGDDADSDADDDDKESTTVDRELADQLRLQSNRFHYLPFGGGSRSCVGKQFALLCMRVFIIEIVRTGKLRLVNGFPEIKTCPFVYPKDDLPLWFEKSRC